jgi:tetratricopeptide (TPR) repeat protein
VKVVTDEIETVIAAHIDTFDARARAMLRSAAVLGSGFPLELLIDLAAEDRNVTLNTLSSLLPLIESAGLGRLRFVHQLVREVAYEGLSYRRRRVLHGRAGDLIVAFNARNPDTAAAPASLHFSRAGRYRDAWRWSLTAGRNAANSASAAEAIAFFDRALDAARHIRVERSELRNVHENIGRLASRAGAWDRGCRALRSARRLEENPLARSRFLLLQGGLEEARGRYAVAARYFTLALRSAEELGSDELDAEIALARATLFLRRGRHRQAIPILEHAMAVAKETSNNDVMARAAYLLDWGLSELGRPDPELRDLAIQLFERTENWSQAAVACNNAGGGEYFAGRWTEALDLYRRSQEMSRRVGDVVQDAMTTMNIGEILLDQGHLDEAEAALRRSLASSKAALYSVGHAFALCQLGRLSVARGDLESAKALLEESAAMFRQLGAVTLVQEVEAREAERLLFGGSWSEALDEVERLRVDAERPVDAARLDRFAAIALAQAGRTEEALARLGVAMELDAPFEVALSRLEAARIRRQKPDDDARRLLETLGVIHVPHAPLPG